MAIQTMALPAGTDLYRLAVQVYGDAMGFTLILRANGLSDPILQDDRVVVIPTYNKNRANDGILASQ